MASVYSTQFGVWFHSTGAAVGGPAAGELWVIRQVLVRNGNTLSVELEWALEDVGTGAILLAHLFQDGTDYFWEWQGRLVIPYPGHAAWAAAAVTGAANLDVYIGGYRLGD